MKNVFALTLCLVALSLAQAQHPQKFDEYGKILPSDENALLLLFLWPSIYSPSQTQTIAQKVAQNAESCSSCDWEPAYEAMLRQPEMRNASELYGILVAIKPHGALSKYKMGSGVTPNKGAVRQPALRREELLERVEQD